MQTEHFDVLIVGAGLSGIGAGHHLQTKCPKKSYAILEGRAEIGGTWDLFRYPGVRSDSDMFTLGYSFRPWKEAKAIADGPSILRYVRETARDLGIDKHIRFCQRVIAARWSSSEARWTVDVETGEGKPPAQYTCSFLYACSGYYNYQQGYTPEFPGRETFPGQIIHPQQWPEKLDVSDKRIVVIGSGATAVTLVPALAEKAAHVTMLQRSPTYITTLPASDALADLARKHLPGPLAHRLARSKNILFFMLTYWLCRHAPRVAKNAIRARIVKELGKEYEVDKHFKPEYEPWDQRVCVVPDADLFRAIQAGRVSMETGRIREFIPGGIRLESGAELGADIIVTATGLDLLAIGGIRLAVDGREIDVSDTYTYKGLMLSEIPNFAFCVGYSNASWTLRADLSSGFVCRCLRRMDARGYKICTPRLGKNRMEQRPILELSSGYVRRALGRFPKQGDRSPWHLRQNYLLDSVEMKLGEIEDGTLEFH